MKTKAIFYIVSIAVAFIIGTLMTCGGKTEIITTVEVKHDTIWPDTVFKKVLVKIPVPKEYTVAINGEPQAVKVYSDSLVDSNLVITYKDSIQGTMLGKNMSYRLFVPLRLIDSVFVRTTEVKQAASPARVLVGLGSSVKEPALCPSVGYQLPKGTLAMYQYNMSLKTHNVTILTPIRLKKK